MWSTLKSCGGVKTIISYILFIYVLLESAGFGGNSGGADFEGGIGSLSFAGNGGGTLLWLGGSTLDSMDCLIDSITLGLLIITLAWSFTIGVAVALT